MHRQQRLVGRHHMLARGNGLQHQGLGNAIATDQLHHHVDIGVGDHITRVLDDLGMLAHHGAGAGFVQIGHHGDCNFAASAATNLVMVTLQHAKDTTAHGADAQQANLDRFHKSLQIVRGKKHSDAYLVSAGRYQIKYC
ncbi:hypothetical protein D3C72_1591190 [compost metagenome]